MSRPNSPAGPVSTRRGVLMGGAGLVAAATMPAGAAAATINADLLTFLKA